MAIGNLEIVFRQFRFGSNVAYVFFKYMEYHYLPSGFRQLTADRQTHTLDSSKCLLRTLMA